MLTELTRRELLTNLLTYRLAVALVFAVVLSALTTFIGSLDYSRSIAACEMESRSARERLEATTVYSKVVPRVVLPPDPLSILCRGVLRTTGRTLYIELDRLQIASWPIAAGFDSELMKALTQVDFVAVVALLLSFLAVVLGFDGVCGERERGTLRQVLANPVPRTYLVLGKLLGGSLSLWAPLSVAFAISLLIVGANPDVQLTGEHWARLAVLYLLSCLFLTQVFALALLTSACTRHADTSLIVCLFAWLVLGVGYLNLLPSAGRYLVDEVPYEDYLTRQTELREARDRAMETWDQKHPSPGTAYTQGLEVDGVLRYAHPVGYAWLQRRHAYAVERQLELADALYRARYDNQSALIRQSDFVVRGAVLSPVTNFLSLATELARTNLQTSLFMGAAGRRYRDTYLSWLRGRNAFASRRWFCDDPLDQTPMIAEPAAVSEAMLAANSTFMRQRLAWVRQQEELAATDDRRRLDLSDMPAFGGGWRRSLGQSLVQMTTGLLVMILILGGAVAATFWRLATYDPTP